MKASIFTQGIVLLVATMLFSSCDPQKKIAVNYNYESQCISVDQDGSETLYAWGKGKNKSEAIERAKINALSDVLFKGIRAGKSECNLRPVVGEVNAQEKYQEYFSKFFAENGEYKQFVIMNDDSSSQHEISKSHKGEGSQNAYRIVVKVLRTSLKVKMIDDKILTK